MADNNGLPEFFARLLAQQYGETDVARVLAGCDAQRAVTFRANTLRASAAEVAAELDEAGVAWESVAWYGDAFVSRDVRERQLWDTDVYREGKIYLQSLSSMIPALVVDARPGVDMLDMCAAPGGKTSQMAALAGPGALITACEMHAPRAEKLEYNLRKLGASNVTVMRTDARRMDDFFSFDRILLDAPCSGSGTLRAGDSKVAKRFTPALVEKSRKSQRALLDRALRMLKPGGTLVYSTCSVLACENEDIVEEGLRAARRIGSFEVEPVQLEGEGRIASAEAPAVAGAEADPSRLPVLPTRLEGTLCLCPTALYEGFFVVKIRRKA